ncbi:MAG: PotD/PotF family extracellular solute-binding protein [Lachnospiraceae bacterium]
MKRTTLFCAGISLALVLNGLTVFAADDNDMIRVNEDICVSADYDWTRFQGHGVSLNVYNWGEYISNGSDDSVDVISAFEELTGISVNYTTFDSNETMYAKIKSGAADYDVIVPSDYMVAKMINEEMLLPINHDNVPNMARMDDQYMNQDFDPGNKYSVPYMICTTGIIYNTSMVSTAPTSWADLWNSEYAGNILMFNNSRDAYAIAAFKLGFSINPDSVDEVSIVIEELKAQKPLVQAYVMDEIFDKIEGGEAAVGVYYSGDAITMIDDNPDLAWVFPEEGSVLSIDNMCIPTACRNQEAAEMFINYMCEIDVGVANCEYIGYTTPSTEIWECLDDEMKYNEIAYPSEEELAKTQVFTNLSNEVNDELDTKWSEMKSYNEGGNAYTMLFLLMAGVTLACFNIWRKIRKKMRSTYQ